uniref:Vitellogenin domain-containing protein n=1 Tax=Hydatigena taeniaeformis TaxID=6205 RepID=A0A0R3WYP9_HYDTA
LCFLVVKAFSLLKRPHLPTLALALSGKTFDQAQSIIDKLGDEAIPTLASFANSQFNYIPLVLEVMKRKPLEARIALVNRILDVAKTNKILMRPLFNLLEVAAKPDMQEQENSNYDCLKDRLSIPNQVFLRAFLKLRTTNRTITAGYATGSDYFESVFPGTAHSALRDSVVKATKMGKSQALYETLLSIQKSHPSKLPAAVDSVMLLQFLMSGHR